LAAPKPAERCAEGFEAHLYLVRRHPLLVQVGRHAEQEAAIARSLQVHLEMLR